MGASLGIAFAVIDNGVSDYPSDSSVRLILIGYQQRAVGFYGLFYEIKYRFSRGVLNDPGNNRSATLYGPYDGCFLGSATSRIFRGGVRSLLLRLRGLPPT